MNVIGNCWNLWYNIVCWPVVDVPKFRNGQIATLVTGTTMCGLAVIMVFLGRKYPPKTVDDMSACVSFLPHKIDLDAIDKEQEFSGSLDEEYGYDDKAVDPSNVHVRGTSSEHVHHIPHERVGGISQPIAAI